nr:bifunctional UDP-N-acetylglucosamine diphosphorylase/glucosamine-1-phosphate N-acetyltransferase GlmU [Segniliparus rugosus]
MTFGPRLAVLVLAAGSGTRMRSKIPKPLHRIAGRSMLEHAVRAAAALEPAHLAVVVSPQGERVAEEAARVGGLVGVPASIAIQPVPDGTGGAAEAGLAAIPPDPDGKPFGGTVLVIYSDFPMLDGATLGRFLASHHESGAEGSVLTRVVAEPYGYGRILRSSDGALVGIVEEREATDEQRRVLEVNSGVYAFEAPLLRAALPDLGSANSQGERYLTDVVEIALGQGRSVIGSVASDPVALEGCNDLVQLADLAAEFNRRILRGHMLAGVTVVDPASTWIDVGVEIEPDVRIEPGTQLKGATSVKAGAQIGPDTTLEDTAVGEDAVVSRTHATCAQVGDRAQVGPYAYLRPGTVLGAEGKIGTFVETKNAKIGAGSKIPHLTYAGDVVIGEHSNIGASSVFVNYDGVNKHTTVVGDHVRAGSDTMFVAPLAVGHGAYTGAGTVLTEDVPPGALAVSSGKQRIIPEWTLRKRPGTNSAKAAAEALGLDEGESST